MAKPKKGFISTATFKTAAFIAAVFITLFGSAYIGGFFDMNVPQKTVLNSINPIAISLASSNYSKLSNEINQIANDSFATDSSNKNRTISEWQNVKAFGAKGDGLTDDTNAVQIAVNAGSHIYFPPGTYVINQVYISNVNDVILLGYDATLIKMAGSVKWSRILDIEAANNITILGLTFDGNKQHVGGAPEGGCGSIYAKGLTHFLFKDLKICNSYYGSVNLSDCHVGDIKNSVFDDIDVGIIGMDAANSDISIDQCVFSNGTSEGISFGIYTKMTAGEFAKIGYHDNLKITNCRFINKNANCIQLRNAKNVLIANNSFVRTDPEKCTAGIMIDPNYIDGLNVVPDRIDICSNQFQGMRFEGVVVTGGTNVTIRDNYFDSIHSFNVFSKSDCTINNNIFVNIQPGVQTIFAQGNNIKISDNYFKLDSIYVPSVIHVSSATAGVEITSNTFNKSTTNASPCISYSNSSPNACIISGNFGLSA